MLSPTEVKVSSLNKQSSNVYRLGLVSSEGVNFAAKGYTNVHQIGRCYALNIDS